MKSITAILAITSILLSSCGQSSPANGKWELDIPAMKTGWAKEIGATLTGLDEESEESKGVSPEWTESATTSQGQLLKHYSKINLSVRIHKGNTFSHSRKVGDSKEKIGKGTWILDDNILTLTPTKGSPFLEGMKSMKFNFTKDRFKQVHIVKKDKSNIRPVLIFRRS